MPKRVQGLVRTLTSTRDGPFGLYFLLSYRDGSVLGAVDVRVFEDARFASPLVFTVSPSMDLGRDHQTTATLHLDPLFRLTYASTSTSLSQRRYSGSAILGQRNLGE